MTGSGLRAPPPLVVVAWPVLLPWAEVNRAQAVVVMRMGRAEGGHDAVVAIVELNSTEER
jgi:hypothetical protein